MILVLVALLLIAAPPLFFAYAYAGYPLLLWLLSHRRPRLTPPGDPAVWPLLTITVPSYNEEGRIRATLENLLAVDYPPERRQILVVSDASTDRTDAIVAEFADRGVDLLRLSERRGKTAAENAAGRVLRGEIVVNTDATIRILPQSLKALVRAFQDPTVGVASGRDVSAGAEAIEGNQGESGYVGYEMWVRSLETRLGGIVGASGCFYAFRREIHDTNFPDALSRDFACAMIAREHGFRAVSVDAAVCIVPRAASLHSEFRRKIRTMSRGIETLWYKRHLMNPVRYGGFAMMLLSHKLARWLFYLALPWAVVGLLLLTTTSRAAVIALVVLALGCLLGALGMRWPAGRRVPLLVAVPGFALASNLAGVLAWLKVLRREQSVHWEPTRRPA
ncbi:MAG TPA: glycosyltransferase family 2 protein [Gemmatimonadaceae bacterium]|nr:glycosyltransferase family 2 protein [Gemmatimonadaceae bacterium]